MVVPGAAVVAANSAPAAACTSTMLDTDPPGAVRNSSSNGALGGATANRSKMSFNANSGLGRSADRC